MMRLDARADHRRVPAAPELEPLEPRLFLAADPAFGTALSDYYVLTEDGPLTIGIDGFDADAGDSLSISVEIAGGDPGVIAQTYDYTSGNRFALLHFSDAAGNPVGDILVQLFEGRSPLATDRFITLATSYFDDDGNPLPADVDNPAFYTDVILHRIITEFMIQTGDAENGDGTGGSPLGDFADQFDPSLSFANRGALAMANSGPNTNDSQIFITDVPTTWLNDLHTIFGQVITGWDVYQSLINLPVNASNRPDDPPVLSSVEIIDSPQDGSITLIADDDFLDPTEVTITLTDDLGNTVSQTITLVPAEDVTEEPTVESIDDASLSPDVREVEFDVTYAGADPVVVTTWSNYDGVGDVGLTVVDPAAAGDPYILQIDLPAEYDGTPFTIAVGATLAGYGNLTPSVRRFELSLGDRPTIDDPGTVSLLPGGTTTVALTITDTDETEFDVTAETDTPGAVVTIDPNTYELTITAPADLVGTFEVTVTAVESGYAEFPDLVAATRTITVYTLGDRPAIAIADPIVYVGGGELYTFDAGITDDGGLDMTVELTSRINSSTFSYVRVDPVTDEDTGEVLRYEVTVDLRSLPQGFSSSMEVVLTAVEADYTDLVDATTYTFHVVSENAYDPPILGYLIPDNDIKMTAVFGDRLYVGTTKGMEIYDLSDPVQPELLGSYTTSRDVMDIIVVGETAYVATYGAAYGSWVYDNGKLLALDISDPDDITLLDSVTTTGLVHDIDIEGDRLYVANGLAGVGIYDISDPEEIDTLTTYPGSGKYALGGTTGVAARNGIVYVADQTAQLVVLNALDIQNVRAVSKRSTDVYSYTGTPAGLAVNNDTLYLIDSATGLFVYDLASPTQPSKVGWVGWPSSHLAVHGDLAVISQGGFHRFIDVSDPDDMMVLHSRFAPGWVGTCSFGDLLYAPHGSEGLMIMDAAVMTDAMGITSKRKVTDGEGVPVTIKITGGGTVRVHIDEATGEIIALDVVGSTTKTKVKITTPLGLKATIGNINVYGSIKSLAAGTTTLTGNLIVEGNVSAITLGDIGGDTRAEQLIRIDGPDVLTATDAVAIKLKRVNDLRIDSAVPIKSLTAVDWLDDESDLAGDWLDGAYDEADGITAPSLDSLLITGANQNSAGDFQADLTLNEHGAAPKPLILGSATVAGEVSEGTWAVYGRAGLIKKGSVGLNWVLNVDESPRPTTVYNTRTFTLADGATVTFNITGGGTLHIVPDDTGANDIEALEIHDATAKTRVTATTTGRDVTIGDIQADGTLAAITAPRVTLTGDLTVEGNLNTLILGDVGAGDPTEQLIDIQGIGSIDPTGGVAITLGDVTDLQIDSAVVITSLTVASWTDTAASDADGIVAPAIDKLISKGDFQADLTLNEDGHAPKAVALGSAAIAGVVSGATWDIYGATGAITGINGGDWTRNVDTSFRTTTVYDSRTFDLDGGRTVTLTITGGTILVVTPDDTGEVDIASIHVASVTPKSKLIVKTTGGDVTVDDIFALGSMATISAADLTLTGDLNVAGILNSLVLGDIGGDTRGEQVIRIAGSSSNPKVGVAITLGSVTDLRIHSDMPIKSLTATEWLDDETEWDDEDWAESEYSEVDAVIAPSLGALTVKPLAGQGSGDFHADLDLNSEYTATAATVLGSADIAGTVGDAIWLVTYGNTGMLAIGAAADDWTLDVDGTVTSVVATGDLGGSLTADWFGKLTTKGTLTAEITALDSSDNGKSIGLLKADVVDGTALDVMGAVQTVNVGQWTGGFILADSLGTVTAKPAMGSAATGDFTPDMTVTGTVGPVIIAGDAAGNWAATTFKSVTVTADADGLNLYADRAADSKGEVLGLGKLIVKGRLSNSRILAAGNVGTVTIGAMENTDVYAGYVAATLSTVTGLPSAAQMNNIVLFDALARIKTLTVKGLKNDQDAYVDSFIASNVAASKLGSVNFAYAALDAAGDLFGATGKKLTNYSYKDDTGRIPWWPGKAGAGAQPDDIDNLVVRLV